MSRAAAVYAPSYRPPTPIAADHLVASFRCGKRTMDDWLRDHATGNEGRSSRTYVVTQSENAVIAYYSLSSGDIELRELPRRYRHDQPPVVPVVILGRLAVDLDHRNRGLGGSLLKEAMQRTLQSSLNVAAFGLVVQAIDDDAVGFYARFGFKPLVHNKLTMFLPIKTIGDSLRPF